VVQCRTFKIPLRETLNLPKSQKFWHIACLSFPARRIGITYSVVTHKLLVLLGAVLVLTALAACSPKKPENIVKDYLWAAAKKRFDDAIGYLSPGNVKGDDLLMVEKTTGNSRSTVFDDKEK